MPKKYIQRADSRYENNEYPNMPSVGYLLADSERLSTKNKSRVDWNYVEKIVKKYGLHYTFITDTFCWYLERGVFQSRFILYFKTDLDSDYLDNLCKNKQYDVYRKFRDLYKDVPQKLHDCAHELDENTPLLFDTGWAGNCGLFGSHDVRRNTYSGGDSLYTWSDIENFWDFSIHDTAKQLKKGVYFILDSWHLKGEQEESDKWFIQL